MIKYIEVIKYNYYCWRENSVYCGKYWKILREMLFGVMKNLLIAVKKLI